MIIVGDCIERMRELPDSSVDAICTDPPAGIAFMGREWDRDKGGRDEWVAWLADVFREAYRVARPGAHAFVWALPRTSGWTHRALEDAGWEVRDCVTHLFGSGFPKSHNLPGGLGTALKPAAEFWYLARKPLIGTVAANVMQHGTGALNIDACRIGYDPNDSRLGWLEKYAGRDYDAVRNRVYGERNSQTGGTPEGRWPANVALDEAAAAMLDAQSGERKAGVAVNRNIAGREKNRHGIYGRGLPNPGIDVGYGDTGGASRFFYVAKASRRERNAGLEGMPEMAAGVGHRAVDAGEYAEFVHPAPDGIGAWLRGHRERVGLSATALCGLVGAHGAVNHGGAVVNWERGYNRPTPEQWWALKRALGFGDEYDAVMTETRTVPRELFDDRPRPTAQNVHPTVKPIALMRWLVRLVTPPGGTVLDPFAGSGSTGCAAALEGVRFVGIEQSPEYAEIAERRIAYWSAQRPTVLQPALPMEGAAD